MPSSNLMGLVQQQYESDIHRNTSNCPEIKTILSLLSTDSDVENIYGVVVTNFAADIASRSTCPMSKQRGLYIEKGKGGLADRSKLFFSPFQTISPRVNTIIIRELGSDRFKLFFWHNYLPHHFTHNMSALYRLSGGGEERWSFYNILFNAVLFSPDFIPRQNCIWEGWSES